MTNTDVGNAVRGMDAGTAHVLRNIIPSLGKKKGRSIFQYFALFLLKSYLQITNNLILSCSFLIAIDEETVNIDTQTNQEYDTCYFTHHIEDL